MLTTLRQRRQRVLVVAVVSKLSPQAGQVAVVMDPASLFAVPVIEHRCFGEPVEQLVNQEPGETKNPTLYRPAC